MGKPTFENWNSEVSTSVRRKSKRGFKLRISSFHMKVSDPEFIGVRGEPGELKHLSTRRKGHQQRLR